MNRVLERSEGADAATAVGWQGAPADAAPLHVITLLSSTAPMPLQAPKAPELAGLAVFRSRRVEDGRERFRLHIGYFPSVAAAEKLLPVVRLHYPAAIVTLAPSSHLGSLEDTAVARFSILRPLADAPAARPHPHEPVPAAFEPPHAPEPAAVPEPPTLSASEIVRKVPPREPPPRAAVRGAEAKAAQRYAVQLVWSREAIDLDKIPSLAIFGGYLVYAVETEPGGRRMYGVRLGFYDDPLSARLVAQYVRSEFKGVTVVPVSEREVTRASNAAIRLTGGRSARGAAARTRWPQGAVTVDYAPKAPAGVSA